MPNTEAALCKDNHGSRYDFVKFATLMLSALPHRIRPIERMNLQLRMKRFLPKKANKSLRNEFNKKRKKNKKIKWVNHEQIDRRTFLESNSKWMREAMDRNVESGMCLRFGASVFLHLSRLCNNRWRTFHRKRFRRSEQFSMFLFHAFFHIFFFFVLFCFFLQFCFDVFLVEHDWCKSTSLSNNSNSKNSIDLCNESNECQTVQ